MKYEGVEEVARLEACEKVKQIVKAIKAIKIKYYLNFSKISPKDEAVYKKLEENLEEISEEHDLNGLKTVLMQELSAKYDGGNLEQEGNEGKQHPDDILLACYGAIDAQVAALRQGKITQALRCQGQLKKYVQELDEVTYNEILNYKREKFAELMQSRDQLENKVNEWNIIMKGMCRPRDVKSREKIAEIISNVKNKSKEEQSTQLEDAVVK